MKKILVTGANSFIGQHLIPYLEISGYEVQGIIKTSTQYTFQKIDLNLIDRRPYLLGDLSDIDFINNLNYKPDSIIHLAANRDESSGILNLIRDNVTATNNLLSYSRRIGCSQIIALSSVSVHGQISTSSLTLNSDFNNPTHYGLTKRLAEIVLLEKNMSESIFVLRIPAVLGIGAKNHWISKIFKNALSHSEITQYNSSNFFNNVVYINDLLEFITSLLNCGHKGNYVFPIASTIPVTIENVISQILRLTASKSKIINIHSKNLSFIIEDNFARENFSYISLTTSSAIERFVKDEMHLIK